jgi:hypothetical protein
MGNTESYAVILMADSEAQVWPCRGRSREELEAFCATCGAAVVDLYPRLEDAVQAAEGMGGEG